MKDKKASRKSYYSDEEDEYRGSRDYSRDRDDSRDRFRYSSRDRSPSLDKFGRMKRPSKSGKKKKKSSKSKKKAKSPTVINLESEDEPTPKKMENLKQKSLTPKSPSGSPSSSLSYSPVDKYPERYKDILSPAKEKEKTHRSSNNRQDLKKSHSSDGTSPEDERKNKLLNRFKAQSLNHPPVKSGNGKSNSHKNSTMTRESLRDSLEKDVLQMEKLNRTDESSLSDQEQSGIKIIPRSYSSKVARKRSWSRTSSVSRYSRSKSRSKTRSKSRSRGRSR